MASEQLDQLFTEFGQLAGHANCDKLRAYHAAVLVWQAAKAEDPAGKQPVPEPILLEAAEADKV